MTIDLTNYIWSFSNLQQDIIVWWLIVPTIFGVPVIYNVILSCYDKVSRICLYMVDHTKRVASVGLAQARPNNIFKDIQKNAECTSVYLYGCEFQ